MAMTSIEKIEASQNSIHIYLREGGTVPGRYTVLERAPYETEEATLKKGGIPCREERGEGQRLRLSFQRFVHEEDRLYHCFSVMETCGDEKRRLGGPCCVTDMDAVSAWDYAYPTASTLKGLQVKRLEDGLKLGLGHAALNMNLPCILQAQNSGDAIIYRLGDREFYFNRAYMEAMDAKIKALTNQGVVVNLIIINRREWHGAWGDPALDSVLMHPCLHPEGVVSAFHVTNRDAFAYYQACLEFLSQRYMRPDGRYGRVCGWIIGNEVNAQWIYSNAGEMELSSFVREYTLALRTAFYAVRKYYAQARVYVSLDHCWNMTNEDQPLRFYKGLEFITAMNRIIREEGDFYWCMAYHPYPQDLSRADFWNDELAWDGFDTGKITYKNIEVLPAFLAQESFLCRGERRRIILSEQGVCSGRTPEEEALQADAFVLAYEKIVRIPEIDSFIYHSHIDEKQEGLYLGLLAEDGRRKAIYDCFAAVDGPRGEELFRAARERVGEENCRKIKL